MTESTRTDPNGVAPVAGSAVVDEQLVSELVARASAEGVSLTGEGGQLQQLAKRVLECSLEGGMDAHPATASTPRPAALAATLATASSPRRPCVMVVAAAVDALGKLRHTDAVGVLEGWWTIRT